MLTLAMLTLVLGKVDNNYRQNGLTGLLNLTTQVEPGSGNSWLAFGQLSLTSKFGRSILSTTLRKKLPYRLCKLKRNNNTLEFRS